MKDFRNIGLSSENPALRGRSKGTRPAMASRPVGSSRKDAPVRREGFAASAGRLAETLAAKVEEAKAEAARQEAARRQSAGKSKSVSARQAEVTRADATTRGAEAAKPVKSRMVVGYLLRLSGFAMMGGGIFLLATEDGGWPPELTEVVAPILVVAGFVEMAIGSAFVRAARKARR